MPFTYDYPRPAVTVDMIITRDKGMGTEVLLIRRAHNPFEGCHALPGGFVDADENLEDAAHRELCEETGLRGIVLQQFYTFGDKGRDPRGHTVSVVFYGEAPPHVTATAGDDAASLAWFPLNELPELAFDHQQIIQKFIDFNINAHKNIT